MTVKLRFIYENKEKNIYKELHFKDAPIFKMKQYLYPYYYYEIH
jgi:hypothetical protein